MPNDTHQVDSVAVKGIAAKVQEVLAQPGTLLSFPLQPIAYADENLRFLSAGGLTAAQAQTLAEFSELVNRLPLVSQVWRDDGTGRHLWDVYAELLGAELADSQRSADEEVDYQAAYSALRSTGSDGLDHPTPLMLDYLGRQSAYLTALSAWRTSEAGPNADLLKAVSDQAYQEWLFAGHKDEVESHLLILLTLGDKDPSVVWSRNRTQFDPTQPTAFQTAPNGMRYATTGFAPTAVMDVPWVRMTMSREELMAAGSTASAELAGALDAAATEQTGVVEGISFDFTAVDVMRPWFDPAMFDSRGWRLRPGSPPLSDGVDPPSGSCPAFVTKVVFARNISITRTPVAAGEAPPSVAFIEPIQARLTDHRITKFPILMVEAVTREVPRLAEPIVVDLDLETLAVVKPSPVFRRRAVEIEHAIDIKHAIDIETLPVFKARTLRTEIDAVQRFDFPLLTMPITPVTPPIVAEPTAGSEVVSTPAEFVFLIAFQCRLLGLTPNPDPALPWPAS